MSGSAPHPPHPPLDAARLLADLALLCAFEAESTTSWPAAVDPPTMVEQAFKHIAWRPQDEPPRAYTFADRPYVRVLIAAELAQRGRAVRLAARSDAPVPEFERRIKALLARLFATRGSERGASLDVLETPLVARYCARDAHEAAESRLCVELRSRP